MKNIVESPDLHAYPNDCAGGQHMIITLKHLANEFDIDPFKLRRMFRKRQGNNPKRRWRWEEGQEELKEVRQWLASQSGTQPGQLAPQRTSSAPTTTASSPSSPSATSSPPKKCSKPSSTEIPISGSTTKR